jgi:hypothetical protein
MDIVAPFLEGGRTNSTNDACGGDAVPHIRRVRSDD